MQEQVMHLSKKFNGKIDLLNSPTIELSSKTIRSRMEEGKSVKYDVPDKVYGYILENELYI
jgi:nicotinate-nucleotide adenylyltransferase